MGEDYISEKIEQYERKLKQAEKAGKHNKAKKYQEKLDDVAASKASAAILGYGPNSGDDSGRVVVQPRAIATRTRSL